MYTAYLFPREQRLGAERPTFDRLEVADIFSATRRRTHAGYMSLAGCV